MNYNYTKSDLYDKILYMSKQISAPIIRNVFTDESFQEMINDLVNNILEKIDNKPSNSIKLDEDLFKL